MLLLDKLAPGQRLLLGRQLRTFREHQTVHLWSIRGQFTAPSLRGLLHLDRADTKSWDGNRMPHVNASQKLHLLLYGQLLKQLLDGS